MISRNMTWPRLMTLLHVAFPSLLSLVLLMLPINISSFQPSCGTPPVRCMSGGAQGCNTSPPVPWNNIMSPEGDDENTSMFLLPKHNADSIAVGLPAANVHHQCNREASDCTMKVQPGKEKKMQTDPRSSLHYREREHEQGQQHHGQAIAEQRHETASIQPPSIQERRLLGSMEKFMLPRPVGPYTTTPTTNKTNNKKKKLPQHKYYNRPPMNHIAAFILSSTPSTWALRRALDNAVRTHPMLRAKVTGNGYPKRWLDPFRRMVRWNGWGGGGDDGGGGMAKEEYPLQFVVYSAEEDGNDMVGGEYSGNICAAADVPPNYWGGSLHVVYAPGTSRQDLDGSWQSRFEHDLDCETVVAVIEDDMDVSEDNNHRDLWKLELHRLSNHEDCTSSDVDYCYGDEGSSNSNFEAPCALVLTTNHAISDQGSVNLIMDQILSDISELEDNASSSSSVRTTRLGSSGHEGVVGSRGIIRVKYPIKYPSVVQPVPPCLEDSLLGRKTRTRTDTSSSKEAPMRRLDILDIIRSPFSSSVKEVISYASRQIQVDMRKLPTLYPSHNAGIINLLDQVSILFFGSPLLNSGTQNDVSHRKQSSVEYRTLSAETTSALVKKSKVHRVPMSMTLAAAVAAMCSDYLSENNVIQHDQRHYYGRPSRIYKVLQSLDTRRFPSASDCGDTLSCQAGGMDLVLGPLSDCLGHRIVHCSRILSSKINADSISSDRQSIVEEMKTAMEDFWEVARQSYRQTSSFLKGGDADQSVRTFDLGMSLCDIGRLCETFANSKVSQGRYWSASITNVGEYERQHSIPRKGISERCNVMATHGNYRLDEVYYATSHARVGATFPVGCITVGGKMSITVNPPWPLISKKASEEFADAFVELLGAIAEEG